MPAIVGIRVDYDTGGLVVKLAGGEQRAAAADSAIFEGHDRFVSTELSFVDDTLDISTRSGERLVVEVPPADGGLSPRRGRRVVYLDQNQWIYLSRALVRESASEDAQEVATYLGDRVEKDQLILPLSLAHHVESGFKGGPQRERLAETMLRLSRGWVMKHPLRVRREELQNVAGGDAQVLPDVISTVPWFRYDDTNLAPDLKKVKGVPLVLQRWWAVVVSVLAAYDTLLDPVEDDARTLKQSAAAWAAELWAFSEKMAESGLLSSQKRGSAFRRMVGDMSPDIEIAYLGVGRNPLGFGEWFESLDREAFSGVPYLNRWYTVFGERLSNPQQPWEANDLMDLLYLPCAAAYCDVVVTEKSMAHYLKLADRAQEGAVITPQLRDLPEILEGKA